MEGETQKKRVIIAKVGAACRIAQYVGAHESALGWLTTLLQIPVAWGGVGLLPAPAR